MVSVILISYYNTEVSSFLSLNEASDEITERLKLYEAEKTHFSPFSDQNYTNSAINVKSFFKIEDVIK